MNLYAKLKDIILIVCIVAAVFAFIKLKSDLQSANTALSEYKQNITAMEIELGKIRASTAIVTANSEKWKSELSELKTNNAAIYAAIKKADEKISTMGHIIASIPDSQQNDQSSTSVTTNTDSSIKPPGDVPEDQIASYNKEVVIKGKSKEDVTKDVDFSLAWVKFYPKTKLWDVGTYGLNYNIDIIRSQTESGETTSYVNAWMFNSKGDKMALDVNANFTELKLTDEKFFLWSPNVNITGDSHLGLGFSISTMGYGKTKRDMDWRFLQVGVGYSDDDHYVKFIPVDWNIGQVAPFINNSYIGPSIDYGGSFKYGLTLSISF